MEVIGPELARAGGCERDALGPNTNQRRDRRTSYLIHAYLVATVVAAVPQRQVGSFMKED